jgi:hypothetical protein
MISVASRRSSMRNKKTRQGKVPHTYIYMPYTLACSRKGGRRVWVRLYPNVLPLSHIYGQVLLSFIGYRVIAVNLPSQPDRWPAIEANDGRLGANSFNKLSIT